MNRGLEWMQKFRIQIIITNQGTAPMKTPASMKTHSWFFAFFYAILLKKAFLRIFFKQERKYLLWTTV